MRLLHSRYDHGRQGPAGSEPQPFGSGDKKGLEPQSLPMHRLSQDYRGRPAGWQVSERRELARPAKAKPDARGPRCFHAASHRLCARMWYGSVHRRPSVKRGTAFGSGSQPPPPRPDQGDRCRAGDDHARRGWSHDRQGYQRHQPDQVSGSRPAGALRPHSAGPGGPRGPGGRSQQIRSVGRRRCRPGQL